MSTVVHKEDERGFTMAELLIVVAIVAVLVAIAIPVFTTQLEKSREAVDLANVRSAYSAYQTSVLADTAPDGGQWDENSLEFYIYTTSGSFEKYNGRPDSVAAACRLISKAADLSDFVFTDAPGPDGESGWKDYVIVATNVFENNFGGGVGKVLALFPCEYFTT